MSAGVLNIPPERSRIFAPIAEATKTTIVAIYCRNATVAAQYALGVEAAGGDAEQLRFLFPKGYEP